MAKDDDVTEFEKPFWVRPPWAVLFDLIKLQKIRPWSVDLSHLLTTLIKEMREKGYIDFSASGVALLSSAIIYRMKSELILELQEPPKPPVEKPSEFLPPPVQLPYRFEYASTTLENLTKALEEILKSKTYMENQLKPVPTPPEIFPIQELDDFMVDIENKIEDMYRTILSLAKENSVIRFSELIRGFRKLEMIRTFLLILFLATSGRIQLWQDEDFGEMYIGLL